MLAVVASLLAFGLQIERRTALRRSQCFTDLGVYSRAAWAVRSGENLYTVTDSNGLHYNYPPAFAILFTPLAHPAWIDTPAPEKEQTIGNWPSAQDRSNYKRPYSLDRDNFRFFCIVGVWYCTNVVLELLSVHLLASVLEGRRWSRGPPISPGRRARWWALRIIPLLACVASIDMDLSRGQSDLVMLAAISAALYLAALGREFAAGIFLALPAAIKIFPIVLIGYPVWRRRRKMLLAYIIGLVLFFVALPVATFGLDRSIQLYRTWMHLFLAPSLGQGIEPTRAQELSMSVPDNQSLLAVIHNWEYYSLPRDRRPGEATWPVRLATYVIGVLTIFGLAVLLRKRPESSPRKDMLLVGLLIGLSFLVAPVVRNAYFLLLLPLLIALLDYSLPSLISEFRRLTVPPAIVFFMATDLLVRVPPLTGWLRDLGMPLISVVWLMAAGASVLLAEPANQLGDYSQMQVEH